MLDALHKTIIAAAHAAGRENYHFYQTRLKQTTPEQITDMYIKALYDSRDTIKKMLEKHFPDHSLMMEEGHGKEKKQKIIQKKKKEQLVIESLDGGTNFKIGLPYFATAISLVRSQKTKFTVIYYPVQEQTYYAIAGEGAWLDERKITVNKSDTEIDEAVFAYINGYMDDGAFFSDLRGHLYDHTIERVLTNWCPTMDCALLANGSIDCVIGYDVDIFDSVAGKLLMKEAGAVITDFSGEESSDDQSTFFVAAASKTLNKKVVNILQAMDM